MSSGLEVGGDGVLMTLAWLECLWESVDLSQQGLLGIAFAASLLCRSEAAALLLEKSSLSSIQHHEC